MLRRKNKAPSLAEFHKDFKLPAHLAQDSRIEKLKKEVPQVKHGIAKEKKKQVKLGYWNKRRLKKKPETSFLIRMKFSNGTSKEFVVSTKNETFKYMKRVYYLRYENSWFNLTQNQYELDFFDDYPVPLDREVLKKGDIAYWSVTSSNLKPLIEMEYIKALASSADIDKYLKMNATLSVFLVFIMLILTFFMFKVNRGVTALLGG